MALAVTLAAGSAHAYPDGAPWGASDPDATESCASCHYDYDPVMDSAAIAIEGLPESVMPGARYSLSVAFDAETAVTTGFQLTVRAAGGDGGAFTSSDDDIEVAGAAARSTSPKPAGGPTRWLLEWEAPTVAFERIVFLVAASAANDDQSPLGDTIHYRAFDITDAKE